MNTLTLQQEKAITLLLSGKSITEVAKELGVTRQTIWEWKKKNRYFIAEFNQRKEELFSSQSERLFSMVQKALNVVEEVLEKSEDGNLRLRAALTLLRNLEIAHEPGPTTPEEVEKAMLREEARKKSEERLEEILRKF